MDSIDASIIGLQATLQILQQYYQSGTLQADVSAAFRRRGLCIAHVVIAEGKISSCYIQDKTAKQQATSVETLLTLDLDMGPFTWRFHPEQQKPQPDPSSSVAIRSQSRPSEQLTPNAVPRRIAVLDLSWLTAWPPQQKRILRMVYTMVDGQRTVATIERSVPLPHTVVQEALVILIAMQIITINNQ